MLAGRATRVFRLLSKNAKQVRKLYLVFSRLIIFNHYLDHFLHALTYGVIKCLNYVTIFLQGQKAGNLAGVASKGIATTAIKAAGAGASEISSILEQRIMGHTRY